MDLKFVPYLLATILVICLFRGGNAQVTPTATPSTATVAENVAGATSLAALTATGGSGTYTFQIVGTSRKFQIATAELQTKTGHDLDFETSVENVVQIIAVDTSGTPLTGTTSFTLTLTDANDAPTFAQARGYSFSIAENATAGTTVGTVTADDVDAGTNGNIASYTISASGNTDTTFTVSNAGVITVASGKIADDLPYILEYIAADGAGTALSATTTVVIVKKESSGASTIVGFTAVLVSLLFQVTKYL